MCNSQKVNTKREKKPQRSLADFIKNVSVGFARSWNVPQAELCSKSDKEATDILSEGHLSNRWITRCQDIFTNIFTFIYISGSPPHNFLRFQEPITRIHLSQRTKKSSLRAGNAMPVLWNDNLKKPNNMRVHWRPPE